MKKLNIFLIILIFCVVFSISSVAASDLNDTSIANTIENNPDTQDATLQAYDKSLEDKYTETYKEPTKVTVKTISGKEKSKANVKVNVKTDSNTPVSGVKVNLKIDGKTYQGKTNSLGIAKINVKIPKTDIYKVSSKIKNNKVTKTTKYKKTYNCIANVEGNDNYDSSSAKFKVISKKNNKIQKYKIIKKQIKTITIPYKQWGIRKKVSGHYRFAIVHDELEVNKISILVGDAILQKFIKFSSKVFYKNNGKNVYIPSNKWLNSKRSSDIHEYRYTGEAKMYVTIKYNAYTFKKI